MAVLEKRGKISAEEDPLECFYVKESNDNNNDSSCRKSKKVEEYKKPSEHRWSYNWTNIILFVLGHLMGIYGIYLGVVKAQLGTLIWFFVLIQFGAAGIIAGAHRLWTHRTYKAHWLLRVFLMVCNTFALQYSIYEWSYTHRMHHKYSDTDADPHNARRGFFFSHIGWVLVYPHPEVNAKRSQIDATDLWNDPVVRYQKIFYLPLLAVFWLILPTVVPVYFWRESLEVALALNIFRHMLSVHQTSLVNSAAHLYGDRVYDHRIDPTKHAFTTFVTLGEAYHNYHHAFPWDYSASEFGWRINWNPMTAFIDSCAWLGLAWDRKVASEKIITERVKNHGDDHRLEAKARHPPLGVFVDTLIGFVTLFWALWIILALKMIYTSLRDEEIIGQAPLLSNWWPVREGIIEPLHLGMFH